jgi:hypothetical protein
MLRQGRAASFAGPQEDPRPLQPDLARSQTPEVEPPRRPSLPLLISNRADDEEQAMAIMRTGYMDHEAGEVLIGQGYAVSVVEFAERDGRITVETVWRKPEGVTIELEDLPF